MFKKILIANRGEIACRVIKTAQRLGVVTVAVYSEADRDGLHVRSADEARCIGPAPSSESYLSIDRVIDACKSTGAEAVHPGYGFLSENAQFAQALAEEGIEFIGPSPQAITAMGDKITSKRIAEQAGVNTVPGHADVIESADHAKSIAREIGYPVMLKASAGGGGKGMRIAWDDEQCRDGFERARNEARASFNDERVFVEKFINEPRHIEIQVLGDRRGNLVYLGERECSIQRRHQKIIEEAPSPFVDEHMRAEMGRQALALAAAVQYSSAGTVEFIVDPTHHFYFLEMNTRLQVEHPVTEMVTGLDLVELMMRVAAGETLPFGQQEVSLNGWALETRIYAEDPERDFVPSTGRLNRYAPPSLGEHVRLDTGVDEGSEVSVYYDPMIAKLVTYDDTRNGAIARMRDALDEFVIRGVRHNAPFLASVVRTERFAEGRLSTDFVADEYPNGFDSARLEPAIERRLIVAAAWLHAKRVARDWRIGGQLEPRVENTHSDWVVMRDDTRFDVRTQGDTVALDGASVAVQSIWRPGDVLLDGQIDGAPVRVQVEVDSVAYRLSHAGARATLEVLTPRAAELARHMPVKVQADMSRFVLSPMPGLLLKLSVQIGDRVKAGQELAVVEAMKMENVLRADAERTVAAVLVKPGESLAADQPILEFEQD